MKILYCIYGLFNSGGMERVLSIKANYMADILGYNVHIVTTNQKGRKPFFDFSPLIMMHDLGINYAEENVNSIHKKILPFPYKLYKHRLALEKLLMKIQPDVTISMFGNEMFFLADIKDKSKKIIEAHFSKFHRLQLGRKGIFKIADIMRDRINTQLCKKYDKLVILTEEDKTYWTEFTNIEVIPNPSLLTANSTSDLTNKQVLAIGRYTHQKGFDLLIKAWSIINKKFPDWKLKIVGSGILYDTLTLQIRDENLENCIILKKTDSNKIIDEYLSSSIYALSSRYEGFPMVLLEAAACGIPVVAFKCKCGPKDIIEDGINGFLIEEENVIAFAEGLSKLMENPNLLKNMGYNISLTSQKFNIITIMDKWKKLFESVLIN